MQADWEKEKKAYEDDEKEIAQGRQAIVEQIQESKDSQKKLELKIKDLERRLRQEQNDLEDTQVDLKIKKKELNDLK